MGILSNTIKDYAACGMAGQGVFSGDVKKVEAFTAKSGAKGYKITFYYDDPNFSQEYCFLFGYSSEKKIHGLKIALALESENDLSFIRGKCCVVKKRQEKVGDNGYPLYDYYFFHLSIIETLIKENECPPLPHEKITRDNLPF